MDKQKLFHNLVQLAGVDGKFTEEEVQLLVRKAELWGIPSGEFETALAALGGSEISLNIPADKLDRVELLKQMILMIAIDGELAEIEKSLCASAAMRMGFSAEEFAAIVDSMIDLQS